MPADPHPSPALPYVRIRHAGRIPATLLAPREVAADIWQPRVFFGLPGVRPTMASIMRSPSLTSFTRTLFWSNAWQPEPQRSDAYSLQRRHLPKALLTPSGLDDRRNEGAFSKY